jgi:hypothetical protein
MRLALENFVNPMRDIAVGAMQNMSVLAVDHEGKPKPGNRAELMASFAIEYSRALVEILRREKAL